MAYTDDEPDPLTGTVRVVANIRLERDTGSNHYGSRQYETAHTVEITFGRDASHSRVARYVGAAVADLLRIEGNAEDHALAKALVDLLRATEKTAGVLDDDESADIPEPEPAH